MFVEEELKDRVEFMHETNKKHIGQTLGIELTHVAREKIVGTMPVDERTHQPFGLLHGGASVVLAETLMSIGSWMNIVDENYMSVGVEVNANHLRAKRSGIVTGTATPVKLGSTVHVWRTEIADEKGRLICTSRCTLSVVKKRG
jgi:uncharacterized protein (TIGR00369 family)